MKNNVLTMVLASTITMLVCAEEGTVRHWTGAAANNNWNDPGNYDEAGKPDPEAQDTLVFPDGANVTLNGNDADSCNIAKNLYRMKVADDASNVVLTVNVPQNVTVDIDGAISPTGNSYGDDSYNRLRVVKKGPGLLQLNSDGKVNANSNARYGIDYYSKFIVEEGTLRFPKNLGGASNHAMYVGYLAVSNGATAFTGIGRESVIVSLYGDGVITNDAASAQTLRIETSGDFSGRLDGSISYNSRGRVMLRGTNSAMTSSNFTIQYNRNGKTTGVTGAVKIGRAYEPSSIGLSSNINSSASGGKLLYLGNGERTDKNYYVSASPDYLHFIDGGETGGLVWEGAWGQANSGVGMVSLILEGANASPCEMEGPIYSYDKTGGTNFTFHISKQGTGTWHLHHNDNTTMTGGFTVRAGTLRFDTIGETNVVTSLGKATNLGTDYGSSTWIAANAVSYAHTLGDRAKRTTGTLEYMGETNCYSSTRATVISGTGILKQSGAGALVMSGFSPVDANAATLVLDGGNTSTSNVVANVTNSAAGGVLSVVKRGAGTWTITENATFTGPLYVEEGTLVLKPAETNYTWFRWTWQEVFDTGETGSKGCIMGANEFALYDADGNRCNLNLSDRGTHLESAAPFFYRPYIDDGGWFGDENWRYLQPGECSIGKTADNVRTYRTWWNGTTTLADAQLYPSALFDGGSGYFSGFVNNRKSTLANKAGWLPIILRLPEGSPAVKYWDYVHPSYSYRGVRISKLEGSVDGWHWDMLDSYDCGADGHSGNNGKWVFKAVAMGSEAQSELGAPGQEICGVVTNAWNFMTGNPVVTVNAGATLKADGDVTLRNLKIDASTGGGTYDGFTFAADTQVEVTNLNGGEACVVPVSFANATGLDNSADWTWTFVSQTGKTLRGRGRASSAGIRYIPRGTAISFK